MSSCLTQRINTIIQAVLVTLNELFNVSVSFVLFHPYCVCTWWLNQQNITNRHLPTKKTHKKGHKSKPTCYCALLDLGTCWAHAECLLHFHVGSGMSYADHAEWLDSILWASLVRKHEFIAGGQQTTFSGSTLTLRLGVHSIEYYTQQYKQVLQNIKDILKNIWKKKTIKAAKMNNNHLQSTMI